MKMLFKRILCISLSLICCLGAVACTPADDGEGTTNTAATTDTEQTREETEGATQKVETTEETTVLKETVNTEDMTNTDAPTKTEMTSAPEETTTLPTTETTTIEEETTTMPVGEERKTTLLTKNAVDDVKFNSLPLGAVKGEGWLLHQARLMADNITKDMEMLSPDCKSEGDDRSGWLGGTGESWERGTYYTRGLVAMAYALDDAELKAQAQKWIDWTLESQTESGMFGPHADNMESFDYWAVMPMLMALTYYADATEDARVEPFLTKYFAWESEAIKTKPIESWGKYRAGDNIFCVLWLYNRTKDGALLDLIDQIYAQTYNWSGYYTEQTEEYWEHIVNLHQSFKLYPIMFSITGDEKYLDWYYEGVENVMRVSGRMDGMSNGDEKTREILSVYGTETCAVAERMLSDEIALYLLRDASIADHLENITYNAWPQQLLPDGRGQVYFTMQNQISANLGNHGFTSDGGDRSVYGAPGGFPCCAHNYHMGWPLFIASMWMTTSDGGLAVGAYGPNNVTSTVGNGTAVKLTQTTNYPYEETVTITINADKTDTWSLYLRVPEWCAGEGAELYVNGHRVDATLENGEYFRLQAEWHDGDVITLVFPMEITYAHGENNSIAIRYGGVLYALKLTEQWKAIDYNAQKWNLTEDYTSYDITTRGYWNYAFKDFNFDDVAANFEIIRGTVKDDMIFKISDYPISLKANFVQIPSWRSDSNGTSGVVPASPVSHDLFADTTYNLTLVPYAFTRVRITLIPWTGEHTVTWTPDADTSSDTIKFTGVTAAYKSWRSVTVTERYTGWLNLNYTATSDMVLQMYVNTTYAGDVIFKKGEGNLRLEALDFNVKYYNIIEFRLADGSEISDKLDISLTVDIVKGWSRYEAEAAAVNDAIVRGNHVGGIDNVGASLTFSSVYFAEAGTYTLRIFYCAPNNASHTLSVDGERVGQILYEGKGTNWGIFSNDTYADIVINVTEGNHTVKIEKTAEDYSFAELDYFTILQ